MSFSPGEYVEALCDHDGDGVTLRRGALYCVESCEPLGEEYWCDSHEKCAQLGVRLRTPSLPEGKWWCSETFKPIYKPKDEIIDALSRIVKAKSGA